MTTAQARTDHQGRRVTPASMLSHEPMYGERRDPWTVKVVTTPGHLGDIYGDEKYALLARYLHKERGIDLHANIRYGRNGTIRLIIIGKRMYRSDAYRIYTKR